MAQDKRQADESRSLGRPRATTVAAASIATAPKDESDHAATEEDQIPPRLQGPHQGQTKAGATLNFGQFGLKAMEPERITARQIEAARRAITREMKRVGRVWIRIFPDVPVSKKPTEVRMGSGKGAPEFWAARVEPGPHHVRDRRRAGRRPRAKRCASARPSCRSRRASYSASPSEEALMKTDQRTPTSRRSAATSSMTSCSS